MLCVNRSLDIAFAIALSLFVTFFSFPFFHSWVGMFVCVFFSRFLCVRYFLLLRGFVLKLLIHNHSRTIINKYRHLYFGLKKCRRKNVKKNRQKMQRKFMTMTHSYSTKLPSSSWMNERMLEKWLVFFSLLLFISFMLIRFSLTRENEGKNTQTFLSYTASVTIFSTNFGKELFFM